MTVIGRTLPMAPPTSLLEQLPVWMKVLGGTIGGGSFVAFLKYLSDRRGHDVTKKKNADEHTEHLVSTLTEKLLAPMKEVFLAEQANLRVEIKELKIDNKTTQANYLTLQEKYVELKGVHANCEMQIMLLNGKVQDLEAGQAKAELRFTKREQELMQSLNEQRMLHDTMIQARQLDHLAEQVEKNTETLKGQTEGS